MRVSAAPLLLVSLALAACDPGPISDTDGHDPRAAAVAALERETGVPWTVRWHRDLPTPALLEGRTAPLIGANVTGAPLGARRFLDEHRALFRLDAAHGDVDDGEAQADELGMVHVRMGQRHQGLPVWGHDLRMHFDPHGALVRIDGRVAPLGPMEQGSPSITVDEAKAAALSAMAPGAVAEAPELVVDAAGASGAEVASARLAWRVEARVNDEAAPARTELFIDAGTGEVYRREEQLDELRGTGTGVFGDRRAFEIASRGKRFYMEDATTGSPMQRIYSAGGASRLPGTQVSSDRPDRWDQVVNGRGAAVDAAAWIAETQAWYERVHGRRGPFDRGGGIRATVHYGRAYPNAFWNGEQLAFGDGDGRRLAPLAAALDIVAHEYTHAVSEASARLGHRGEKGALNEGISDVFACFIERAVLGARSNWTIGETIVLDGRAGMRDLADPRRTGHPSHVIQGLFVTTDDGGVHINATIIGHAAFLMTEGGDNRVSGIHVDGIGFELAERVWYRALTRYLGSSSDFRDVADATVTAARDLAGRRSAAAQSVLRAWQAVGVLPAD